MFNKNDLVIGTHEAAKRYGITTDKALMVVTNNDYDVYRRLQRIVVKVVGHAEERRKIGFEDKVYEKMFTTITLDEYKNLFPDAEINMDLLPEKYRTPAPPTLMVTDANPIPDEELQAMVPSITEFLKEYRYHATETGVFAMLKEWGKNNAWMIELFKNHPKYNGKYQIVFDEDYPRTIDGNVIEHFYNWLYDSSYKLRKAKRFGFFTRGEICRTISRIDDIINYIEKLIYWTDVKESDVLVKGKTLEKWKEERKFFANLLRKIGKSTTYKDTIIDNEVYDREIEDILEKVRNFASIVYYNRQTLADEEFATKVNNLFPKAKAVSGQKVSRIVNRVCNLTGMDKLKDYNKEFAKYADAINPKLIKRFTVISCHPLDYLTMSFGNSWTSCHSIDKHNVRGSDSSSNGGYSAGTLSYMLDNSSFVYYTVDRKYDGNELELQDKINRCMFHMGEDKLVQARIYPQSTDYESGIYKAIREIAQKVIADCLDVPNLWKNIKGTDECQSVIESKGKHYRDYNCNSNCNVSYLKRDGFENTKNLNTIIVGHDSICVGCGETYTDTSGRIECYDCWNQLVKCAHCGRKHRTTDMNFIDGKYYCNNCSFYCKAHDRFEIGARYGHISWVGDFCEESVNEGLVLKCAHCGTYSLAKDKAFVHTSDGKVFCSNWCAYDNGYRFVNDVLYPESELKYCNSCNSYVLNNDYNNEKDCCNNCAKGITETDCLELVEVEESEVE